MCTCPGLKLVIIPRRKWAAAMKNTAAAGPNTEERMPHLRRNSFFTARCWVACHEAIIHVDWNSFRAMAPWKNTQDSIGMYFLEVRYQACKSYNLIMGQHAAEYKIVEAWRNL